MSMRESGNGWSSAARVVSGIFHPFLLPCYFLVGLLFTDIMPPVAGTPVRLYLAAVIILNMLVIPAAFVWMMRAIGLLKDFSLSTRRERMLPLLVVAVCYGLCAWMLAGTPVTFLLRRFLLVGMWCVLFALTVNFKWQISLHTTAAGGIAGTLLVLVYVGYGDLVWILCGSLAVAGLLASSRLELGRHDPAQVAAGFMGGAAVAALTVVLV